MIYTMNLNDGTEIAELSYKPDVGNVIRVEGTGSWYKVTHVNDHQQWCLCKLLSTHHDEFCSRID